MGRRFHTQNRALALGARRGRRTGRDRGVPGGTGFEVLTAADGSQALRLARAQQSDMVLLDLLLPGLHGFHVCTLLRNVACPN
jgi:CheY-like chemotaxis protein